MDMKRSFDIIFSLCVLFAFSPLLIFSLIMVFLCDFRFPFYVSSRVGRDNTDFKMIKIRTMRVGADLSGVTSTSDKDPRITFIGRILRRTKVDELSQFLNVLAGSMSVVGPRPNTRRNGVENYTDREMAILSVSPGITDLASIVFSNEGEILSDALDPDDAYDKLIRPLKSDLAIFYVERRSFALDLLIIFLTVTSLFSKKLARKGVLLAIAGYDRDNILGDRVLKL